MPVGVISADGYDHLSCFSSDVWPLPQFLHWLVFHHQCWKGWRELGRAVQAWVGTPAGTGPRSPLTPSNNWSGRGVADALPRVGTTDSVLSTPPVYLKVYLVETPRNPQFPPLRPLICRRYPPPSSFGLPLLGCRPCYGYDTARGGDMILHQSSLMTHM